MKHTRNEEITTMRLKRVLGQPWKKEVEPLPTYTEPKNATITTTAKNY